ncbi:hypothetical protein FEP99_01651 [Burkholderia pseudomultivorans]|nr:hypothetical protein [Burkholderia pseudomultivorans]
MRAARYDPAVDGHAFARPDADGRADAHLRERHVALDAVFDDARAVGAQRVQRADRFGRLPLRTRFEPLAEAHQRDDDGRRLEVQMAGMRGIAQQHPQAQPECRRRAERDEQIHVARAGLHRMPRGAVEARTEAELDDRREHELQPAGQHRVDAERRGQHRRDERRAQHGGPDHEVALADRFAALAGVGVGRGAGGLRVGGCGGCGRGCQRGAIAGGRDGRDQRVGGERACAVHRRALGCEIHRRARNARHGGQRFLDATGAGRAGHAADVEFDIGGSG